MLNNFMAVYTKVSDAAAQDFLQAYDLGALVELTGIQEGVSNSNYRLTTTVGAYILTLYEKRVAASDLPFFIGLMRHLHGHGLSCPLPIAGRDGEALRRLQGKAAAIVSLLPGQMTAAITATQIVELGAVLAKLHAAGKGFAMKRANALGQQAWAALADSCSQGADSVYPGLTAILAREVAYLQAHWPQGLPAGV